MFGNCYRDFQPHKALDQDKNALACQIDNPQVRITGALHAILCRRQCYRQNSSRFVKIF